MASSGLRVHQCVVGSSRLASHSAAPSVPGGYDERDSLLQQYSVSIPISFAYLHADHPVDRHPALKIHTVNYLAT